MGHPVREPYERVPLSIRDANAVVSTFNVPVMPETSPAVELHCGDHPNKPCIVVLSGDVLAIQCKACDNVFALFRVKEVK